MAHLTPEKILQTGLAFWPSKVLLSAVEMGLFTELAKGPEKFETLRGRMGLHPRAARDFFDALTALGFLKKESDAYENTPETELFLDSSGCLPAMKTGSTPIPSPDATTCNASSMLSTRMTSVASALWSSIQRSPPTLCIVGLKSTSAWEGSSAMLFGRPRAAWYDFAANTPQPMSESFRATRSGSLGRKARSAMSDSPLARSTVR